MLKNYLKALKSILTAATSGKGVTLQDYLSCILMGFTIIAIILFIIAVISLIFVVPPKIINVVTKKEALRIKENPNDFLNIPTYIKSMKRKSVIVWVLSVVAYLPVAIPTAFLAIDFMFGALL